MYKKKKIKDENLIYALLIMLVLVLAFTGFSKTARDFFNVINEKILMKKTKNIIISDDITKNYINSLKDNINELKEIINVNKDAEYNCINATVIYRNPTYWYDTITINKGENDGISKNSMVIDNSGLIGIVKNVMKNSSEVSLLTNIDKKKRITIGIKNEDNISYGIISNYNFYKNELTVNEITTDIELTDGMVAITTGFTNTFIEGIIIGKVKEIKNDNDNLSKLAIIDVNTDFNNIKYVCVVGNK